VRKSEKASTADARRNFFGNVPQIPDFEAEPPIQLTGKRLQSLEKNFRTFEKKTFLEKKISRRRF